MSFAPLQGYRVIDLTQVLAGPFCSYQLGLLGAEVIKIEPVDNGDWARLGGSDLELESIGMATSFLTQNAGKQSLAVDLKHPSGLDIVKRLVRSADVFIENFRPGTAKRLGLGANDIMVMKPDIIYASISAFGQDGPMGDRPAYDHVIQAVSGIMMLTGDPKTLPNKVGSPYIDYSSGQNGAMAILAAILERNKTGKGQYVDIAMLDSALLLMASHLTQANTTGKVPEAAGNEAFSGSAASGVFDTKDGKLALAANNERQTQRLANAINKPDILEKPRFKTPKARRTHSLEFRELLAKVFLEDTASNWENRLTVAGVPAARILKLEETLSLPQIEARGILAEHKIEGSKRTTKVPTLGFKVNGERPNTTTHPPLLGQDTDQVLSELGLTKQEIDNLKHSNIVA